MVSLVWSVAARSVSRELKVLSAVAPDTMRDSGELELRYKQGVMG